MIITFEQTENIAIVYQDDDDLDGDPAGKVLVAVEETRGSVQCVPSVIFEYHDYYTDCELL